VEEFSASKAAISNEINSLDQKPKDNVVDSMNDLSERIQKLQKYLTDSIIFLPSYDIQQSQQAITKLKNDLSDKRTTLMPRKKFAFKSKKIVDKPNPSSQSIESTETKATKSGQTEDLPTSVDSNERLSGQQSRIICKAAGTLSKDFSIAFLQFCTVYLCDKMEAMRINNLSNCNVYVGPVSTSIFIENCTNCCFGLASQQIRIHTSTNCDFYLRVKSNPIIEDSNTVRFAPYNFSYNGILDQLKETALDQETEKWANVEDFNWLKLQRSPNWSIVPENERKILNICE